MDENEMTFLEAGQIMNDPKHVQTLDTLGAHALYLASFACDRQTAEAPIQTQDTKFHCPECNNWIAHYQRFCDNCGQAINWRI